VGAVAILAALPTASQATTWTLSDGNATALVEDGALGGGSMFSWSIDNVSHLYQQWFWYRTNGREYPVENLGLKAAVQPAANLLDLTYGGQGPLEITIRYLLTGGSQGSGKADIAESIRIVNVNGRTINDFSFFQYTDFDLAGAIDKDYAKLESTSKIVQWNPGYALSETTVTPQPSRYEIAIFPTTLNNLNDGDKDDLAKLFPQGVGQVYGPADLTWAFQWSKALAPGASLLISKDKQINPVPDFASTLILLGSALTALGVFGRKFRA